MTPNPQLNGTIIVLCLFSVHLDVVIWANVVFFFIFRFVCVCFLYCMWVVAQGIFTLFVLQSSAKFVIMLFFHPGFLFSIRPSARPLMPWNWTSRFRRTLTWRANADFNTGLLGTFWENKKNVAVLYCKSLGGYHRNTATCGNKNHIQSPTIVQLGHITRNNGLCACQNCTWAIFEGALSLELCEMSHMWRGFKYGEKCVMHWPDVSKTRQGIVFVRIINVSVNILVIFELGFWILLASYYPMRCPPILVVSECIQNTCGDSLLHKSLCFFHEMFVFFQIMVVATVEKSIQQLLCQSCCIFLCAGQISDLHQWVFDAMNDEFLCRLSTPTCWTQIVDSAHLIKQKLFSMIFLLWQHIGTSTKKCNYLIFGWNYCSILYLQHVGTHKLNWRSVLILELIFFE